MGELNQARKNHRVFIQQDAFVVLGGSELWFVQENGTFFGEYERSTERCTFKDNSIQCSPVDPVFSASIDFMMRVPEDYCPK